MLSKNTTFTIGSKFIILLANFLIVVVTTQILGSAGRGQIALIIANISLITILNNILCGSTIAFHAPRLSRDFLLATSLTGVIVLSLSGSVIFSLIFSFKYFQPLFAISLLTSLTSSISMYWLGKNNIKWYNILTLINPVIVLIYLLIIYFIFKLKTIDACFSAYYFGLGTVFIVGVSGLLQSEKFQRPHFEFAGFKKIISYGFNNELNYFIQFLNYRLSYYFIAKWLGLSQLGVFSIVVSISEAVWVISKSMSAIHFSNVINSQDQLSSYSATTVFSRQSLWISLLLLGLGVIIPKSLYQFIFGAEFGNIKIFIIYLVPGVISIAVSNLYGHYFAGIGKLIILRNKSLIGLGSTLILLPLLITKYQLTGVCITLNVSYFLSSLYLYSSFRKEGKLLSRINTD
ncbi:MAG: oligosaccharide flippase family protein [Bacteroidia bacterium]|nr:oligosaccharide flippase family protein [Bacteroidia bacterium]